MATVFQILCEQWPDRGGWTVDGETIRAGDGGPVPTLEEIEAARPAAEAAMAAAATESARQAMAITRAQFGEMLIRQGIKAQVLALIEAIPDATAREIMLEWFEYAPTVRRTSPKVEAIRQALGIPAETADEWFAIAATFE